MNDQVARHQAVCNELNQLYERKNHDYGDSFHKMFMEEGMGMCRIRLGDKLSRFKTLSKGQIQQVTNESIRDTLLDLANYAIMTVLELDEVESKANATDSIEAIDKMAEVGCVYPITNEEIEAIKSQKVDEADTSMKKMTLEEAKAMAKDRIINGKCNSTASICVTAGILYSAGMTIEEIDKFLTSCEQLLDTNEINEKGAK